MKNMSDGIKALKGVEAREKKVNMAKKMGGKGQHFKPEDDFKLNDVRKEKKDWKEKSKGGYEN